MCFILNNNESPKLENHFASLSRKLADNNNNYDAHDRYIIIIRSTGRIWSKVLTWKYMYRISRLTKLD